MPMSNEDASTVAGIILIVLDIVTVAGRFYSRWFTKAGFRWDDWTILIALLTGLIPGILTIYASTVSSTGPAAASNFNPDYVFTEADIVYTKITFSTSVLFFLVTCVTKISLLLLLYRIFSISRSFRIRIYVAEAVVVAFWLAATICDCLNCIPLEWTWKNGNADPRYCINFNTFWLVTGIFESVIDLGILILPFSAVWKLQLDRSKKYGVAGIFLLGGFVLFSGVAKIILSYVHGSREPDFSNGALFTVIHLYLGILCANISPCWPLFARIGRASTGSWVKMSELGRRWYGLGSSGGRTGVSADRGTGVPQQGSGGGGSRGGGVEDKARAHNWHQSEVEVGPPDFELPMYYGSDRQPSDDRVRLNGPNMRQAQW